MHTDDLPFSAAGSCRPIGMTQVPAAGSAGKYTKGELVEYYSETHGEWCAPPAHRAGLVENFSRLVIASKHRYI